MKRLLLTPAAEGDPSSWVSVPDLPAKVTAAWPVEATQENIAAATTFDGHMRTIAKARKFDLPTPSSIERFRASWHTLSLMHLRKLKLEPGDCDLLKNLREQVFPTLPIRVVNEDLRCSNASPRSLRPVLEVEVLIPVLPVPIASR